jgi:hypothetical protein
MSRPSALAVLRLITSSNLAGLLDRQVYGLAPPEDLIDVRGQFPDYAIKVRLVRHKSASLCKERIGVDGRQLQPESNLGNAATA